MLTRIDVISIFPDWFESLESLGLTGRAIADQRVILKTWNPREFATGVHRSVDDRPFGGGPGMVMRPEPLAKCIEAVKADDQDASVIYLSPQGRKLDHSGALELAHRERIVLLCGRYEGVDQRLLDEHVDEEWSVGDYVLSGGEPAAAVMIDAVVRQLPGVLGHADSALQDSFVDGLLDCPHFTRPDQWRDHKVPDVLLSGDHARIARWRRAQALHRTHKIRPDLFETIELGSEDRAVLVEFPEEI